MSKNIPRENPRKAKSGFETARQMQHLDCRESTSLHTSPVLPEITYEKNFGIVYGQLSSGYSDYRVRLQAGVGYIYTKDFRLIRIVEPAGRTPQAVMAAMAQLCQTMARKGEVKLEFYQAFSTGHVNHYHGTGHLRLQATLPGESEFTALGAHDNVYEVFSQGPCWQGQVSEITYHGGVLHQELFPGPCARLSEALEQCYTHEAQAKSHAGDGDNKQR